MVPASSKPTGVIRVRTATHRAVWLLVALLMFASGVGGVRANTEGSAGSTSGAPAQTENPPPPPPPASPSGFTVTDRGTGGSLALAWNAVTDPAPAGYHLYRAASDAGPFTKIHSGLLTGTGYTDGGLWNGTRYYYQLTAVDQAGIESAPANASGVPSDVTPPPAPTGLQVTDPGTGRTLLLSWSASPASDLAGYFVYRISTVGGEFLRVNPTSITETTYADTGLTDGIRYRYRITAADTSGNQSAPSTDVDGVPTDVTPPAVPTGVVVADPATSDQLDLSWTPNTETDLAGYTLYRSRSPQGPWEKLGMIKAGLSVARDGWLSLGTAYFYRITAVDSTGNESEPSGVMAGTPSAPAPTVVWQHGTTGRDGKAFNELYGPRSATPMPGNHLLVVDTFNRRVLVVNRANEAVWEFGNLVEPEDANPLANGNILIVDQQGHSVMEVDYTTRAVVWQYGSRQWGLGPGQLLTPMAAVQLPGGTFLIADSGNHRIFEVNRLNQIVWQYGATGVAGQGSNRLNNPTQFQVLPNGDLLIADTGNDRVVEVDRAAKTAVWQYGGLSGPQGACRLRGGNTLIADTRNNRLVEVTAEGRLVWSYGSADTIDLYEPKRVQELPGEGNLLVVDQHNHRIVEIAH